MCTIHVRILICISIIPRINPLSASWTWNRKPGERAWCGCSILLRNELKRAGAMAYLTTWNVASIHQVLALARSCSWWGVYRRRCLWPDTYTSLYWSSGIWLSKKSVANWKVSGISIIFRIQCICNLIITFCLNSWIIKFYTSKSKSFGSFGLMFCLTLCAVLVRSVGFSLLAGGCFSISQLL